MTVRAPLAAVPLALLLAVAAGACTTSATAGHAASRTAPASTAPASTAPASTAPAPAVKRTSPPATLAHLGRPGCHPPSPTDVSGSGFREVQGTGRGVILWGLLFFARAQVGKQEKIVWRMTGSGPIIRLTAIGPGGGRHRLAWGPEPHGSSTWNRPGQEWGAGYQFSRPGCWDLHAVRGKATADVWLNVAA